ncbi:fimbrial protein [Pantoea sp. Mb-10]|uniref:fimbrial protein n=1 Tax=unclassified Pantoea TaxID=2630326 RepID=UPI001E5E9CAB|nr:MULTISPECIES: fimbrial protein [unclassified Pantoea]MCE0491340.1 fimbrial protein [Pantoea sp. Mb-10]MCE0502154.1 fimbrial protein [Pantoea sp. Pb-8]
MMRWIVALLLLNAIKGYAEPSKTVRLTVTIINPTCDLNGGRPISVNFGNQLYTTQIDGIQYKKTIPFTLSCANATATALRLKLSGSGSSFDSTLLSTNNSNLGIRLIKDTNTSVPINAWINFIYPHSPNLYAVPVKKSGSTLQPGGFNGNATLIVEFV